jgi:putative DNA primase/helicase
MNIDNGAPTLGGISHAQLVDEVESLDEASSFHHPLNQEQLDNALDNMEPIVFEDAAGLTNPERLKDRHRVVCVVLAAIAALQSVGSSIKYFSGGTHLFVGTHWAKVSRSQLRRFLGRAGIRCGINPVEGRYHRFIDDMENQLRSETSVEEPDRAGSPSLMNFTNGTLEVQELEVVFREHRAEDMLTHLLPCEYRPDASCTSWDTFLDRSVPHEESQLNLAEFMGLLFTFLNHEKALVLLGDGHNGKSVFFEVVCGVLGTENVTHQSLEGLNSEYNRAGLAGFLLNYSSEIGRNAKPENFKKMASGEPIDARLPYGKPFILRQYARLAFNCNDLPRDVEHTHAFFRRLLIIPFAERISLEERVPDLAKQILEHETAGVLNWMIGGMTRLTRQGDFTPNPNAEAAVSRYKLESDSVALFLEENHYVPSLDGEHAVQGSRLYGDYRAFCFESGYKSVSRITFGKRLRNLNFDSIHRNNGTHFFVARCIGSEQHNVPSTLSLASPLQESRPDGDRSDGSKMTF